MIAEDNAEREMFGLKTHTHTHISSGVRLTIRLDRALNVLTRANEGKFGRFAPQ